MTIFLSLQTKLIVLKILFPCIKVGKGEWNKSLSIILGIGYVRKLMFRGLRLSKGIFFFYGHGI